jgi:hypothetical protein
MSWNIKTPGDYINGPLTVTGTGTIVGNTLIGTGSVQNAAAGRGNLTIGGTSSAILNLSINGGDTCYLIHDGTNLSITNRIAAGSLIFQANSAERARFNPTGAFVLVGGATNANGIGVAFPTAQSASTDANTLDDYEEGTWTPTIVGVTTTGTATYNVQVGRYTKVGNLVTIQMYIEWSGHTGTGNMRVSGLPFQQSAETNVFSAVSVGYFHNVSLSANNVFNGYVVNGSQAIALEQYPTGGGGSSPIPIDPAGTFILTASYRV